MSSPAAPTAAVAAAESPSSSASSASASSSASSSSSPSPRAAAEAVYRAMRNPSRKALIIVDMQYDFCEGGALAVPEGSQVIPLINALRTRCAWRAVVLTQDWHPPTHASFASNNPGAKLLTVIELPGMGPQMMWPDHCVQDSSGAKFHADLLREDRDIVVRKGTHVRVDSYSGFGDGAGHTLERTTLEDRLKEEGVTDVFVCGLATDYCVSFTCKDAVKAGFNTFCLLDASRGIAADTIASELAAMRDVGVHLVRDSLASVPTREAELEFEAAARAAAGEATKEA